MNKMLKVLIVDDDYLTRNFIRLCIDWNANGLEIIGEAGTAQEGLALIENDCPDILLTDICMPQMNGMEFSRIALQLHPALKIVIITAHAEFEYAKESLRIGITDFIVKPIQVQELLEVINKTKGILRQEHELRQSHLKLSGDTHSKNWNLAQKICAYMEDNLYKPELGMEEVAQVFSISKGHLGRIMREETGKTFVDFLTDTRIKYACQLLKYSDLKAFQVGERVGIHDPHYFSMLFKKATGESILEFRKQSILE
jgi:YesN/AraC family two-component response regulator